MNLEAKLNPTFYGEILTLKKLRYYAFFFLLPYIRCVNEYNIYVWKNGQLKEQGQIRLNARGLGTINASGMDSVKISNITNCATSFELTIDACVEMKFAVEFIERDWTHTDEEMSQEVRYKTEAIPEFVDKNVTNFHVSYAYNPIIGSQVLDKASIKFPKRILKHANCIKHIQISGEKHNVRQNFAR